MWTHLLYIIVSLLLARKGWWKIYLDMAAYMILKPALGIVHFLIFCRKGRPMLTPKGQFLWSISSFWGLCRCSRTKTNQINDQISKQSKIPSIQVGWRSPYGGFIHSERGFFSLNPSASPSHLGAIVDVESDADDNNPKTVNPLCESKGGS